MSTVILVRKKSKPEPHPVPGLALDWLPKTQPRGQQLAKRPVRNAFCAPGYSLSVTVNSQ